MTQDITIINRRKLLASTGSAIGTAVIAGCATSGGGKTGGGEKAQTECNTKTTVKERTLYDVEHVKGVYKESPWKTDAGPGDRIIIKASRVKGDTKIGLKLFQEGEAVYKSGRKDNISYSHPVEADKETSYRIVLNEPLTAIGKQRAFWDVTITHKDRVKTVNCYEK